MKTESAPTGSAEGQMLTQRWGLSKPVHVFLLSVVAGFASERALISRMIRVDRLEAEVQPVG